MENEELLKEIIEEIKLLNMHQNHICKALQVLARGEVESRLKNIFKDEDEIKVYLLSDGSNTTTEIEKLVSMSPMSISRLWQKWEEEFGIVETKGYRRPYRGKYTLEELAILFGKFFINKESKEEG